MPPSFEIASLESNGTLRLVVDGELDIATAPLLDAALERAEATDARRILLDIAAVPFMDSSGLKALLRAVERSSANGSRLAISRPGSQVRRLFHLSGAADRLPLVD